MPKSQITQKAQAIFGANILSQLGQAEPTQRLEGNLWHYNELTNLAISYVKEIVEINMNEDISSNTPFLIGFLQYYPGFENASIQVLTEMVSLVSYIVELSNNLSQVYSCIIRGGRL